MLEIIEALPKMSWKTWTMIVIVFVLTTLGLGYILLKDYVACVDSGGQYVRGVVGFTCIGDKK